METQPGPYSNKGTLRRITNHDLFSVSAEKRDCPQCNRPLPAYEAWRNGDLLFCDQKCSDAFEIAHATGQHEVENVDALEDFIEMRGGDLEAAGMAEALAADQAKLDAFMERDDFAAMKRCGWCGEKKPLPYVGFDRSFCSSECITASTAQWNAEHANPSTNINCRCTVIRLTRWQRFVNWMFPRPGEDDFRESYEAEPGKYVEGYMGTELTFDLDWKERLAVFVTGRFGVRLRTRTDVEIAHGRTEAIGYVQPPKWMQR